MLRREDTLIIYIFDKKENIAKGRVEGKGKKGKNKKKQFFQ